MSDAPPAAADDHALFTGVQARDPDAWAAFVERFGPLVLAAVRRCGCGGGEDLDVVQTTWERLLDHAPLIAEPRSLPAWVLRTARREAWRVVRRRRDGAAVEGEAGAERAAGTEAAVDEDLERLERVQAVRDGIARLGERCRALLTALFLEGEDPPDYQGVSRRLGIPVGSIGPTRIRCLAKLGALLAPGGGAR